MYMRCVLLVYLLCILISLTHIFTVIVQAQYTIDHARVHLDKRLLLLAREATEAVEALALTIAIVKATVRALSKLGDSADVRRGASSCDSLNDFGFQAAGDGGRADHAIRHGERTTITSGTSGNTLMRSGDDFEEELHAGLARPVIERDKEIHTFSSSDVHIGGTEAIASVGCAVAAGDGMCWAPSDGRLHALKPEPVVTGSTSTPSSTSFGSAWSALFTRAATTVSSFPM